MFKFITEVNFIYSTIEINLGPQALNLHKSLGTRLKIFSYPKPQSTDHTLLVHISGGHVLSKCHKGIHSSICFQGVMASFMALRTWKTGKNPLFTLCQGHSYARLATRGSVFLTMSMTMYSITLQTFD
jgi:hypothetical protein